MFDEQPDGDPHGECAAEIQRLKRDNEHLRKSMQLILGVIDGVEQRCMAADGPVTPTCDEITDAELRVIYELAKVA
jgi:hypothetical protein